VKYVVCIPDGCADEPVAALDGRTPLEVAHMPTLARLATRGTVGRARVIPEGLPAGSDVGNMSILGYDPRRYHSGRAAIEAAAMGLSLGPDEVAYRCNLVTTDGDGAMLDFAGGHPPSAAAAEVIDSLQAALGGEVAFHAGVQYRHIMVAPADWAEADCTPPHDLTGLPAVLPTGPAALRLRSLMDASRDVLARFDVAATQVWFWGQGRSPQMPSFADRYGRSAGYRRNERMLSEGQPHLVVAFPQGESRGTRMMMDIAAKAKVISGTQSRRMLKSRTTSSPRKPMPPEASGRKLSKVKRTR